MHPFWGKMHRKNFLTASLIWEYYLKVLQPLILIILFDKQINVKSKRTFPHISEIFTDLLL